MANLQPINNNDEEQILQQVMKASMDTYTIEQTNYIGNAVYEDEPEPDLDTILKQIKELTEKEALQNTQIPIIPINNFNNDNDNDDNDDNADNDTNNYDYNADNDDNNADNDDTFNNDTFNNDTFNNDDDAFNNDDDDMFEILENIRLLEETEREQARIQLIEQEQIKVKNAIASNRIMRDEQDAEYNNSLLIDKKKEQEKEQKKEKANAHKIHIQSIQTSHAIPIINNNIDVVSGVNYDNDNYEVVIPPTKEQMRQARLNRFNK